MRRRDLVPASVPALLRAQETARLNGPATIGAVKILHIEGRRGTEAGYVKREKFCPPIFLGAPTRTG